MFVFVIGTMVLSSYWRPETFVFSMHQNSVKLNDLMGIEMDFFAAHPDIVPCYPCT